jgi:hypothetical protein
MSGVGSEYPFMKPGDKASKFLNPDVLNRLMGDAERNSGGRSANYRFRFSHSHSGKINSSSQASDGVILVKSSFAYHLPKFSVVGIDDVCGTILAEQEDLDDDLTDEQNSTAKAIKDSFVYAPVFSCTKPQYPRHHARTAILQEGLNPCEVGGAIAYGATFSHISSGASSSDWSSLADSYEWKSDKSIVRDNSLLSLGDGFISADDHNDGINDYYDKSRAYSLLTAQRLNESTRYLEAGSGGFSSAICSGGKWVVSSSTCDDVESGQIVDSPARQLELPCVEGDTQTSLPCLPSAPRYDQDTHVGYIKTHGVSGHIQSPGTYTKEATCSYNTSCKYACVDSGGGYAWTIVDHCIREGSTCECDAIPEMYLCNETSCPREVTMSCSVADTLEVVVRQSTTTSGVPDEYSLGNCPPPPAGRCRWVCGTRPIDGNNYSLANEYEIAWYADNLYYKESQQVTHEWFNACTSQNQSQTEGHQLNCYCVKPSKECDVCNIGEVLLTEGGGENEEGKKSVRSEGCAGTCTWLLTSRWGDPNNTGDLAWPSQSDCTAGCGGGGKYGSRNTYDTYSEAIDFEHVRDDCGPYRAEVESEILSNAYADTFQIKCYNGELCENTTSTSYEPTTSTTTSIVATTTTCPPTTTSTTTSSTTTTCPPTTTTRGLPYCYAKECSATCNGVFGVDGGVGMVVPADLCPGCLDHYDEACGCKISIEDDSGYYRDLFSFDTWRSQSNYFCVKQDTGEWTIIGIEDDWVATASGNVAGVCLPDWGEAHSWYCNTYGC